MGRPFYFTSEVSENLSPIISGGSILLIDTINVEFIAPKYTINIKLSIGNNRDNTLELIWQDWFKRIKSGNCGGFFIIKKQFKFELHLFRFLK